MSQLIDKHVKVPKEVQETYDGLYKLIDAILLSLDDGWQPMSDIPTMVMAAISSLGSSLDGIGLLDDEWRENPEEFLAASFLFVSRLTALISEKAKQEK